MKRIWREGRWTCGKKEGQDRVDGLVVVLAWWIGVGGPDLDQGVRLTDETLHRLE